MLTLPEYPWEAMAPYRELAEQHPQGVVNLSIGTPVDPTPEVIQRALSSAADAPGYPTTHGTARLREAIADWFARRRGVPGLDPANILPTIGSKELVAWLPTLLGLGPEDIVVYPRIAYPTYEMGARIAGAQSLATDDLHSLDEQTLSRVKLIWLNSPGNPTGRVDDAARLASAVQLARRIGAVVASDECYAELPWEVQQVPSILDPQVAGSSHQGLLAVYSVSKQSNLAGYRAAFAAGCPELIGNLVNTRKHAGMIMPAPVQAALAAAVSDDVHVSAQRELYRRRRAVLKPALEAAGFAVEHSQAGLYLWCRAASGADEHPVGTWELVSGMAERGILVGPGVFYGEAGQGYIRVALTASDERITSAAQRLT
ncbi:succinyldiaminopimelate transaminase [Nesterenkonia alkaliphila]|uniref:Aminotransferase n=1 Tax=Nesterenkonia alkaliphila TaxID=1463631 RepID=A0A7K1UKI2_9MICC|nr:succinyldiaminopimelate transaminase [Nesterenkonia alkaliphila]MVT26832.1 succinyldiaminopimelate transaminase [Nesterenkonia alkaliphila]GFZ81757.1 aminotransferase [Nesterenkonia alkaliphila]